MESVIGLPMDAYDLAGLVDEIDQLIESGEFYEDVDDIGSPGDGIVGQSRYVGRNRVGHQDHDTDAHWSIVSLYAASIQFFTFFSFIYEAKDKLLD